MEAVENVRIADEAENIVTDEESKIIDIALAEVKSPTFGFTEKTWRTDLCLVVEGTKLYVAKVILSLSSPVFGAMFQSDFKEKSSDELELPGKKLTDVLEFLRCIYPNQRAQINRDNARAILPLLEEYQVFQHKSRCELVLLETITEETSTDELLQLLKEACLYDLKALRARCIFLISSRPCDALDENYCKSFPSASALNEIFVHVNTSMKRKLAELEQVEEKCELLMQYVSSALRGKTDLKLDPEKKWDDKIIVLFEAICPDNNESGGVEIEMWEVPLKIYSKKVNSKFYCGVRSIGEYKTACDIHVLCILVNRHPNGKNGTIFHKGGFDQYNKSVIFEVFDNTYNNSINSGYILNGKIGYIVKLFMSKPNKWTDSH